MTEGLRKDVRAPSFHTYEMPPGESSRAFWIGFCCGIICTRCRYPSYLRDPMRRASAGRNARGGAAIKKLHPKPFNARASAIPCFHLCIFAEAICRLLRPRSRGQAALDGRGRRGATAPVARTQALGVHRALFPAHGLHVLFLGRVAGPNDPGEREHVQERVPEQMRGRVHKRLPRGATGPGQHPVGQRDGQHVPREHAHDKRPVDKRVAREVGARDAVDLY